MTESLPRSERRREKPARAPKDAAPKVAASAAPKTALITVRGQRYVAPAGRHSQQTHRRAEERAAAGGFATEKEQHASDRCVVLAEINQKAQDLLKQKQQSGAGPKVKLQADSQANPQE